LVPNAPAASAASATKEAARTVRGRRTTSRPMRAATPSLRSRRQDFDGQKNARPVTASTAGMSVTPASSITRTETAIAGPSTRNCPNSASPSVPNATATASAADAITWLTRRAARSAAARRSYPARSCSRNRKTRNSR
jgi:hypothetical protein